MLEKTGLWITIISGLGSVVSTIVLLFMQKGGSNNMNTILLYILLILLVFFIGGSITIYLSLFKRFGDFDKSIQWCTFHSPNYEVQKFGNLEEKINYLTQIRVGVLEDKIRRGDVKPEVSK